MCAVENSFDKLSNCISRLGLSSHQTLHWNAMHSVLGEELAVSWATGLQGEGGGYSARAGKGRFEVVSNWRSTGRLATLKLRLLVFS